MPFILEAVSIVRRELRPDQAVIGFCGGPFTVAGLPDRGQAEPRVPEREADDVRRAGDVARADGEAHRRLLALHPGEGARGRRRDPALRLVGRSALAAGLRGVRAAVLGAHPRRGRLPDDPLRHRHGDAARADARRRRRRDRARLADPARLGLAAGRRRPRRPGQPRRRRPLRAVGADRGGDARRARPRGRPAGPHLQPRPRRHARHRSRRARPAARIRARADRPRARV